MLVVSITIKINRGGAKLLRARAALRKFSPNDPEAEWVFFSCQSGPDFGTVSTVVAGAGKRVPVPLRVGADEDPRDRPKTAPPRCSDRSDDRVVRPLSQEQELRGWLDLSPASCLPDSGRRHWHQRQQIMIQGDLMDAPLPISKVPEPLEDGPVKTRPSPTSYSSEVLWAPQIASVPISSRPDLSICSVHCRETPRCSLPARRAKGKCWAVSFCAPSLLP